MRLYCRTRTMIRFPLLFAAAVLAAACTPQPQSPKALPLTACRLPGVDVPAQCGTLSVLEDRTAKGGRRIDIHVAVVPARLRARDPDPVVVFAGGPGQGAVSLAAQVMPLFTKLNDTRDILFVEQRGTGDSNPLDCE